MDQYQAIIKWVPRNHSLFWPSFANWLEKKTMIAVQPFICSMLDLKRNMASLAALWRSMTVRLEQSSRRINTRYADGSVNLLVFHIISKYCSLVTEEIIFYYSCIFRPLQRSFKWKCFYPSLTFVASYYFSSLVCLSPTSRLSTPDLRKPVCNVNQL